MALVSIAIAKEHRGFGYAKVALRETRRKVPKTTLLAEIHKDNESSLKLFENEGYGFVIRPGEFGLYRNEV